MVVDKYFLFSTAVAFIILTSVLFADSDVSDGDVVLVYGIAESSSGYVFSAESSDGSVMRCFSRTLPVEGALYLISGSPSSDGSMVFVSSLTTLLS